MSPSRERLRRHAPRLSCALLALALLAAGTLDAQAAPRQPATGWRATRVAKWTLLAASVGFGVYAWQQNRMGDDRYADLRAACVRTPERCQLQDGRYSDPALEDLYHSSRERDAAAQRGMIAGEVALLGSAGFFIFDLRHGQKPENIPFDPAHRSRGAAAPRELRVGVRLALGGRDTR